jgi:hypothetical protein
VPRAAVLFIGAARAMVWRAVCENIKSRFLEAITRLGPQQFETFTTSVKRHKETLLRFEGNEPTLSGWLHLQAIFPHVKRIEKG